MPKVAIYCRLSIEDKDKSDNDASASIQNQKAMLRDYCHERDWEIYDIYVDDGYSGIDRSRPEFNRMLRDCEKGNIDIVLCKDQSRFSRDTVVIEQLINDKFLEWGIRFIGVADNADTDSESYSTMRLFTSAYNEMYVKDISAKIRRTLVYKREQGQFIASFAPYGYQIDPEDKHHLVIDEETASVVRQIFDMYISGAGYRAIVLKLNSDGIVSPTEYKRLKGAKYVNLNADTSNARGLWTQSTVARILANEMYTGTLVQGKSHHISYKNKKRKKVEQADWIRIPNTHEAKIQLRGIYSEQLKQLEAELSRLNERHSSAKGRLLAMYKDKLDGVISDEDYALFRQSLSDEERELSARITDTSKRIEECCERIRNTEGQRSIIEKYTHFDKLDRNIADEFIDYVEIGESSENGEREIHIHWKL
ncbi:recombinase family protein [Ruminococcus flavefaciens]|uniref:recombinase family protein n=1 Tax=Ruminococcus flavefaciens TaxID=1265 RepID=UPI0026EC9A5A|nr:recombinase family protein [Ruminococcus flavefaciens]